MATISSVPLSSAQPTYATASSNTLGKDDFLKLLVEQLKNQDPMNPLDGTQFASQLAQFSSVEQLSNINTNLESSLSTNQLMAQSIGNSLATTMIGRDVKASGSELTWNGGDLKFGYTLGSAGATSQVRIYDASGNVVRVMEGTGVDAGDTTVEWDGKDDGGHTLAAGKYTFKVEVKDATNTAMTTASWVIGSITGVRFTSSGTVFLVDGREIPVANILEILNGGSRG